MATRVVAYNVTVTSQFNVTSLVDYINGTGGIYEFYTIPQIVFISLLCVSIIFGNSCVLAAIWLSKNGRESRMNFFIMHLALADLLVGVMVSLTDLATKVTVEWYAGNAMCKIIQFLQAVVTYSSTYMLVSLSIDRYDAVARPMNFSKSGFQARFLVYSAWTISVLFALPALFIFRETLEENKRQCWVDFPALWHWQLFLTVIAVVTFLVPAIIIAACYVAIITIIWSKGRPLEPCGSSEGTLLCHGRTITSSRLSINCNSYTTGRGVIPKAKVRTVKMTLIIVIVFILCWSPYFLYNLLDIYEQVPYNNPMTTLMQSAVPLNSAANPIIYGIFSTRICQNLRRTPIPACAQKLLCCYKESRKCDRRVPRGNNPKNANSQVTDPTQTTFDAHRLCDLKLLSQKKSNSSSTKSKQRNAFANRNKTSSSKVRGVWRFVKQNSDFELAPMHQSRSPRNLNEKERQYDSEESVFLDSRPTKETTHLGKSSPYSCAQNVLFGENKPRNTSDISKKSYDAGPKSVDVLHSQVNIETPVQEREMKS